MFKRNRYYIRVYPNKMEVFSLQNNSTVLRESETPFSSEDKLIERLSVAVSLLKSIIKEFRDSKFYSLPPIFYLQAIQQDVSAISETDKASFRKLSEEAGAYLCFIGRDSTRLSKTDLLESEKGPWKRNKI